MPEKEVIVKCYDKSGTLLTACSATSFDSDIVLMHGLPLAAIMKTKLKKWFISILVGLHSEIRSNSVIDEEIEFMIHDEDSLLADGISRPGCKMISAGMWTCPLVKSTVNKERKDVESQSNSSDASSFRLDEQLVSLFIFLETPHKRNTPNGHHVKIFNIIDKLRKPSRGQNVIIQYTPFLDPVLINSLSRGIVSKVFGRNDCMFLTDAITASCSNGAPIFLADNESSEINGKGSLMGITCTAFELNEITVGICLLPVLRRLLPPGREFKKYPSVIPRLNVRTLVDETIVSISCKNTRSTGVIIDAASGIILTCSHGIPKETTYIHVFHKGNIYPASLVYKTVVKLSCDLAIIKVSPNSFNVHMGLAETPAQIGERVHAAGFPHFPLMESASMKPFMSVGYIAKCNPSSFIMSTCFTFPGQSGGAIVRNGELLGMISSNFHEKDKSSSKGKDYFRLNMAVPTTVFFHHVKQFLETKNIEHLKNFESSTKKFPDYWLVTNSKM